MTINHKKVLLIDDNSDNLIILAALIEEVFEDVDIFCESSGEDGIKTAISENPDIILLDIFMPIMNGFEVCEKIKSDERLVNIPIVFLTASKDDRSVRLRALVSGAEAFIQKPIDSIELIAQMNAMFKIRQANLDKADERSLLKDIVDNRTFELHQANDKKEALVVKLQSEIAERIKTESALVEAQQMSSVGSFELDVLTKKIKGSLELYNILDLNPKDIELKEGFLREVALDNQKASLDKLNIKVKKDHQRVHFECKILTKNNHYKTVYVKIKPILNKFEELVTVFGSVQDVTERKQREDELRVAKVEAENAKLSQSIFLANMSHELRTPLNGLLGMIELTQMGPLSSDQRESLSVAGNSAKALLIIINDILDYSKIEANQLTLNKKKFDLHELVENIKALFKVISDKKDIQFHVFYDVNCPNHIVNDAIRIQQILTNLIGNAIKFTNEGLVELQVSLINKTPENVRLRFSVNDSGIGVEKDKLSVIFDRFVQADVSQTKEYGGTGLGLAISYQLTQLLGGELNCESTLGEGSKFYFEIDSSYESSILSDVKENAANKMKLKGTNGYEVLLLDNDEFNLKLMSVFLNCQNIKNEFFTDETLALKRLHEKSFDVIFMEVNFTKCKKVKESMMKKQTMIALTTTESYDDFEKDGFEDFITKPIEFDELLGKIKKHMSYNKQICNSVSKRGK